MAPNVEKFWPEKHLESDQDEHLENVQQLWRNLRQMERLYQEYQEIVVKLEEKVEAFYRQRDSYMKFIRRLRKEQRREDRKEVLEEIRYERRKKALANKPTYRKTQRNINKLKEILRDIRN